MLEVRTITPNRVKNQSGGTLKILAHNCNHQQWLVVKQKNVALQHCGFKAEFPKHKIALFWVKFINVTVVTQNWTNTRQNFMCLLWPYYPHF